MKRKIWSVILMVALLLISSVPVFAFDMDTSQLVNDNAGLLTSSEKAALENNAQALTDEYGVEVRILTVDSTEGASSISDFAESVVINYNLGTGTEQSIIMLTLDMGAREYDLMAHGQGNDVMTDYGRSIIEDDMLGDLSNGDYAGGFQAYLNDVEDFSYAYFVGGEAVDTYTNEAESGNGLFMTFVAFLIACVVDFLVVSAMAKQMKTARRGTQANQYLVKSQTTGNNVGSAARNPMGIAMNLGIAMALANDDFLYTNRTVTPISTPKNNGGGPRMGGGTSINAGGFSHSSGKF